MTPNSVAAHTQFVTLITLQMQGHSSVGHMLNQQCVTSFGNTPLPDIYFRGDSEMATLTSQYFTTTCLSPVPLHPVLLWFQRGAPGAQRHAAVSQGVLSCPLLSAPCHQQRYPGGAAAGSWEASPLCVPAQRGGGDPYQNSGFTHFKNNKSQLSDD